MRAAAIFGPGCSPNHLTPFQNAESPKNAWQIGMPAASDQADSVVLFGGDGTIHRHLAQLVKLRLPVLVVPTGSGNDFARALNLRSMRDSLAAWHLYCVGKNNVSSIDLGVITPLEAANAAPSAASTPNDLARDSAPGTRYFCSVAGVGLDAEVSRRANRLPRWLRGHGGYALALAPTMFQFAPFPMKILTPTVPDPDPTDNCHPDRSFPSPKGMGSAVEGPAVLPHSPHHPQNRSSALRCEVRREVNWEMKKSQPTLLAAFANTPTYGGGMKIAPRAQMDDGLLDVCVIASVDPFKLFCMFPTVYFGRHLNIREVDYFHAADLRVETDPPLDLYADGEYVCRTPAELGVQRAALPVIVHPSRTSF
jgi:diacylglycerol kinase family enzyme